LEIMSEGQKKSKVARYVIRTVLVVLILVVALAVAAVIFIDRVTATAVRKVTPMLTGTRVELAGVNLNLLDGQMRMEDFVIGNPEGYATPSAIEFSTFFVNIDLPTVTGDKIYIDEILIANPVITLEQGITGSNLGDIQKHVEQVTAQTEADTGKVREDPVVAEEKGSGGLDKEAEAEAEKKVVIRKLTIEGAKVNVGLKGMAPVPIFLPTLTLNDIGEDSDYNIAQAVDYVFNELIVAIVAAAGDAGIDLGSMAGELLAGAGEALADVAGATGTALVDVAGATGTALVDVVSGVLPLEQGKPGTAGTSTEAKANAKPDLKPEVKADSKPAFKLELK